MSFILSLLLLFQLPMGGNSGVGAGTWPANPKHIFYHDSAGTGTGGGTCTTGTTTCVVNVSSISANDSLVCFVLLANTTTLSLSSCSTETWVACPSSCNAFNASAGATDALYVARATGGETTFTCTQSGSPSALNSCGIIDFGNWSGPTVAADASASSTNGGCTSCLAPSLTLTGVNDACMQIAIPANNITGITAPYSTNLVIYFGQGMTGANRIATSPQQPTWSASPSGTIAMAAFCFKGS